MVKRWQIEAETKHAELLAQYTEVEISELPELDALDEKTGEGCAVYFVFDGDEIVYVGSSSFIADRLNYWIRDKRFGRKRWTRICVLPVDERVRFTVENHYIRLLEPRDNIEWVA
jgi:hypothetical protein